jgi:hypothetical protein
MISRLWRLLPYVIAWPIPPRYVGTVALMLCLTVLGMAVARVHSFAGVMIAAGMAVLLMIGVGALGHYRQKA